MTRIHGSRLIPLISALALGCALLLAISSAAHAQSAADQYLESSPDGTGSKGGGGSSNPGGSGGSGGSNSGGSSSNGSGGSGGGSGSTPATKDYNGDGTIDSTDDKIAAKKQKQKQKDKKKDDASGGAASNGDGGGTGSASTPALAKSSVPADNGGDGGSGALWIVLALLVAGPLGVAAWWYLGRRKGRGGTSEPQST
jgi:hypothetical protein